MPIHETPWPDGMPCWTDLATADPGGARTLFKSLLGWDFDAADANGDSYSVATLNGHEVAGIGPLEPAKTQSTWTTYLAAADCDTTCDLVLQAGGSVLTPPAEVSDFGRMAIVADPSGSSFGIWQGRSRPGFAVHDELGTVAWTELMTRAYDESRQFYTAVFGYSYKEITSGAVPYAIAEVNGRPACGLGVIPADVPAHIPPHWRVFFAVPDADAALTQTVESGGMQRRPATTAPYGRHIGMAHPLAGGFAVIEPRAL